jgi:hypothetical protein
MDDIKRQDQIQKVESLIKKRNVTRRDFFGSLGKIAVLSQVVALGAGNFLASCVAMEDKQDDSGKLKLNCDAYTCNDPSYSCYTTFACGGNFNCEGDHFYCPTQKNFQCNQVTYEFNCLADTFTNHYG